MYTTGICDRLFVIGGAKRLCGQSGSFSSWLLHYSLAFSAKFLADANCNIMHLVVQYNTTDDYYYR